jgi:transcriptional regulator with XRE-family HTH domain
MDDIATRIEQLRCERGWSKATLAQRAHLHPQHIYKILSGERTRMEVKTVIALARAFEVTTDYLLGLTEVAHA